MFQDRVAQSSAWTQGLDGGAFRFTLGARAAAADVRSGALAAPARPAEAAPGRMRARKHKLAIMLLVQLAFFLPLWLAAWEIARPLYPNDYLLSPEVQLPPLLLFFLNFLLVWRGIYSRDYHYYLRLSHKAVLTNALLPVVLSCATFLLMGARGSDPVLLPFLFLAPAVLTFPFANGFQHLWISYLSRLGYFRKKILVVGRPGADWRKRDFGTTKEYAGEIDRSNGVWLWKPAGGGGASVVRDFAQIRTIILKEHIGDVLLFSGGMVDQGFERELIDYCQSLSIGCYRVPDGSTTQQRGLSSLLFMDVPVLERFAGSRDSLTAVSLKRLMDIVVSLACLLVFLPVGLLVALAIHLEDRGPVFYVSSRIGKNRRPILFLKFRSMRPDAEKERAGLLAFNARGDGPLFKMKNDPRVTKVGRFLRRHCLDEVPQLLNVLLGSMSLVGPRPHLPREVDLYQESDYLRLECMPGIVGLPQVTGRANTISFREWVDLDLSYRKTWSLALDLDIMLSTVRMLLSGLFAGPASDYY